MQAVSISLVLVLLLILCLVVAATILASPLIAGVLFIAIFGAFLAWRGARRADTRRRDGSPSRPTVPSTEEASYDPVEEQARAATGRPATR
jgi:hypothetical protein